MQENGRTIIEELRSTCVVVTIELYKVLVTLVRVMEILAVLWLDEIITGRRREKSRDKRIFYVFYR